MKNPEKGKAAHGGTPKVDSLPEITYRQLEVFSIVCRERSYANAALELHSTRANVKRVCQEFEQVVGRQLFEEGPDRSMVPTPFALGLLVQIGPLSRSLRKLGEGVRGLHQAGRILRFAAAGEFFRGGLFTDFLATLKIGDLFRSCFARIEVKRFRTALLNAECDVYFGLGLGEADRLESVDLGPVPWLILSRGGGGSLPLCPEDLLGKEWYLADAGEPEVSAALLEAFRLEGAGSGGSILAEDEAAKWQTDPAVIPEGAVFFTPDTGSTFSGRDGGAWPAYRLTACLRRNHPYAELMPRLTAAVNGHGHGH